jgi:hydroxypyruvate reductase/glycerate 2-kinase
VIIKNREEIITSNQRARAVELIEAGISRVLPSNLMRESVKYDHGQKRMSVNGHKYGLSKGRVFVVGGGKASGSMAVELENIVGPESITAGTVNCKSAEHATKKIRVMQAGHPVPDAAGVDGVREMLSMKARYGISNGDTVINLISGGGSALLPCPVNGVTLEDKQLITQQLLGCGADIKEINTVRKHLSMIKGGGLAGFFAPARVVSLIISDVVGDDPDVIASGPAVPDASTYADALHVLQKYGLQERAPQAAIDFLQRGCAGLEEETPKKLRNCTNHIIGNNRMALEAMAAKADELGIKPCIVTAEMRGDTSGYAYAMAAKVKDGRYKGFGALLIGGETTPTLPDHPGRGGRNQHYAAVSMLAMEGYALPWLVASAGSDGSDYLPDAAGAMVDERSLDAAKASGLDVEDYIGKFDSNTLFTGMGRSLIKTGPTGTNVSDVLLYLLG